MILTSRPCIGKEEQDAAMRVLKSGWYIHGQELESFEKEFGEYHSTHWWGKEAVGVSNGTAALFLTLQAYGVGPGDEVIVPEVTAFPTAEAVWQCGATPVPAAVHPHSKLLDFRTIKDYTTSRTKAIIGVHLYGQPLQTVDFYQFARSENLIFIEDCAQAFGAKLNDFPVGLCSDASCFSFYPTKNITAAGDGGAVICTPKIADKIKKLRNHGIVNCTWDHTEVGWNFRMSELSAAILREQLKKVDWFIEERRKLAFNYIDLLSTFQPYNNGSKADRYIIPKTYTPGAKHSYHLFVIQARNIRDLMCTEDNFSLIDVKPGYHYPYTITSNRDKPIQSIDNFNCISLPLYVGLTEKEQELIVNHIF